MMVHIFTEWRNVRYEREREWKWTQSKEKIEQIKAINGGDVCALCEINPASTIFSHTYDVSESESKSKCESIKWFVSASNRNVDRIEVCGRKHFNYLLSHAECASVCVHITHKFSSRSVPAAWTIIVEKHKNNKASHTIWMCADERMISTVLSHKTKKSPIPTHTLSTTCIPPTHLPHHCQNVGHVAFVRRYTQSIYDTEECFVQLKIIQRVYAHSLNWQPLFACDTLTT